MSFRTTIKHLQCNRRTFIESFSLARFSSSAPAVHPPRPPSISLQFQNLPHLHDQDPYSHLKQDPIEICSSIWVKAFASLPNSSFSDLSSFLSKFDLWVLAYQRSCADLTGSFPPRNAIHSHVLRDLLSLRNAVINGKFSWNRKANQLIRSPNDKSRTHLISKRKLQAMLESDEPCFQDRIVQEVLLNVLEPVFEARFSSKSHAFRPGRNAHSFIRAIRSNFAGYLWFLKADLSEVFSRVDENVVMGSLEKAVKDKKILRLVNSALQSPRQNRPRVEDSEEMKKKKKKRKGATKKKKILNENEPKPDPYWLRTFFNFAPEEASKVPSYGHCGILSPLLANVCLNELDLVMEDKIVEYFRPSKLDSIWRDSINDGCHNPAWPEFVPASGKEKTRKMDYIRYGGHFLVGIRGPREDAVRIRKEIIELCESKFGIRLDNSKMEIEHISRGILFLDHIICRRIIHPTLRYTSSGGTIVSQKCVGTLLSVTASLQQCIRKFRRVELVKGDRDPEPLPCNPMLYSSQAHTNSQMNKFLETMADWYRYADNRKKIVGFCAYVIRSSLAKLYAARYQLKSRAKVYRIASRNLSRPLIESSNNAAPEYSDLLRMGLVDAIEGVQFSRMSMIPSCDYTPLPRNWVPDHENILREYIKLQDPGLYSELHSIVKKQGLSLPQDEISEIVWGYKILGACHFKSNVGNEMEDG